MTERRNDEFLDQLLDASLAEYSRAEAPAGLEARVLRRIEEARPRRLAWLGSWQWAAAGAFAVVAIASAVLLLPHEQTQVKQRAEVPAAATTQLKAKTVDEATAASKVPAVQSPQRRTHHVPMMAAMVPPAVQTPRFNKVRPDAVAFVPGEPRLAVFPAPAPLTEQEMLLARAATSGNPAVLSALTAAQEPIKDLEIAPLKIEPLAGSQETSNPGSKPNP